MHEQKRQGTDGPRNDTRTVIVLNADPFLRTIVLPVPDGAPSRSVSIPSAKVDGFRATTPGQAEMPIADWEAIKNHPSAKVLAKRGTLSLLAE